MRQIKGFQLSKLSETLESAFNIEYKRQKKKWKGKGVFRTQSNILNGGLNIVNGFQALQKQPPRVFCKKRCS